MKTKKISRRDALQGLAAHIAISGAIASVIFNHPQRKVQWVRLKTETLGPGDMWASTDPNTPERQGKTNYNLQMQAVHPQFYGKPPGANCGNGWHWRPVSIVECEVKNHKGKTQIAPAKKLVLFFI